MGTILHVDGEAHGGRALGSALRLEGYEVLAAERAEEALHLAARHEFDLIAIGEPLPDLAAVTLCRRLRELTSAPIFLVSARHLEVDKIVALDAGADDYITRPFSMGEFLARVRSALRRAARWSGRWDGALRVGELMIDVPAHRVAVAGREVDLTPREFALLRVL